MALPLERRSESQNPTLHLLPSEGPRIVDTSVYPIDLTHYGWKVRIENLTNGHTGNVSYSLSRKITPDVDLESLGEKIGIVDEKGGKINGYSLSEAQSERGERELHFAYTGIPTAQTSVVLNGLVKEFLPDYLKSKTLLIAFSSRTNDSGLRLPIPERLVLTTIKLPE